MKVLGCVAKSGSTCWDAAKWLIGPADHVIKNDQYDRQCHNREDNGIWWYSRGDNSIH